MVILHVLAPGQVGGLERVVRSLSAGHHAAGHRICAALVLGRTDPEPSCARALEAVGEVIPIRVGPRAYLAERAAIAALCERLHPDVVHTHGYRPDVVDAGAARHLGIPTVTTVHGFCGGGWKDRWYERLQRRALRRFTAVVAVSQPLGDALRRSGVPPTSLHVIRNGWDGAVTFLERQAARRELGLSKNGVHIGWVGRLSPEKGPDVAIEALALLRDTPVTLSLLGDGASRRNLGMRADHVGVSARVTWHGTVPEAARLFPAFDVFVLSSRTEGTPIVLFEAMAAGVPVVASLVGGVPDVLSRTDAWLVPPDNPSALAQAVRDVLTDPAERYRRIGAARRRLTSEFALQPWLERYANLYRMVQR
jgi:glycosyltransferase involved in cell wall biosynthesis